MSAAQFASGGVPVIVGVSKAIRDVLQLVDQVAATDCCVLIEGESGTGKELIARRLCAKSQRSDRPFIPVNCAGISETPVREPVLRPCARGVHRRRAEHAGRDPHRRRRHGVPRRDLRNPPVACSPSCSACSRSKRSCRWASRSPSRSTPVSWPAPTATWPRWFARGHSAATSTTV